MDLGLTGKTALITGGTSGIGLAIAHRLGEEGCRVAICGRDEDRLDGAVASSSSRWRKASSPICAKPGDVAALVEDTVKSVRRHRHRGQQCRHACRGAHRRGRRRRAAAAHFQTKVLGAWELARRAAPHMRKHGGGRFIVIIGQAGKVPQANAIASTVVNAAQHAFVKSLSDELAPHRHPGQRRVPEPDQEPAHAAWVALHNELYSAAAWSSRNRMGRRGAARPLGHAGGHRQCGRVPGLGRAGFIAGPISTSTAATSARSV